MKNFLIKIRYCGYSADFNVTCEDTPQGIENSILDKLGKKDVKWEYLGERTLDPRVKRITYEEVINDPRPIHTKEVLGVRMATGAPEGR